MTVTFERPVLAFRPEPEITTQRRSRLMDYLPAMYASDDFMNRFLCIFEDTLVPLQQLADNLHYYFNPLITSPEMVEWLATWVNLVLDDSWSLEKRRQLIHSASELYSRRGTRRGLAEYLRLYTGIVPEITEYVDGMTLGPDTYLGINTTIAGRERHSFTVTLRLQNMSQEEIAAKELAIRRIIEAEKPAHTAYRLNLIIGDNGKSHEGEPPAPAESEPLDGQVTQQANGGSGPTGHANGDSDTTVKPGKIEVEADGGAPATRNKNEVKSGENQATGPDDNNSGPIG
jgi:phage tail-like protein